MFGYGSFDENSVLNTSKALVIFGFGLPAFSLLKLYSNFYFARGDTKFPFKVSVFTVLANILISIIYFKNLVFYLSQLVQQYHVGWPLSFISII